jgi:hypothetical protein
VKKATKKVGATEKKGAKKGEEKAQEKAEVDSSKNADEKPAKAEKVIIVHHFPLPDPRFPGLLASLTGLLSSLPWTCG